MATDIASNTVTKEKSRRNEEALTGNRCSAQVDLGDRVEWLPDGYEMRIESSRYEMIENKSLSDYVYDICFMGGELLAEFMKNARDM